MKFGHWSESVAACEGAGKPYVIVTILGAHGSTPRDTGTKMIVHADGFAGTIGGGELEHRALERARALLLGAKQAQEVENFPLGEKLGQCCGGSVNLLFEAFVPHRLPVLLFGAGHVGRALAPLLASLPMRVQWLDERDAEFPALIPEGIEALSGSDPIDALRDAPPGAAYVIMTHNHPLDYALAEAALRRDDATYVGVIGSDSKARRFRLRLAHRGFSEEQIRTLTCPIGLSAVPGKRPAEIAVAVAGQLIAHYHTQLEATQTTTGPSWKALKAELNQGAMDLLPADTNPGHQRPVDPDRSPSS